MLLAKCIVVKADCLVDNTEEDPCVDGRNRGQMRTTPLVELQSYAVVWYSLDF